MSAGTRSKAPDTGRGDKELTLKAAAELTGCTGKVLRRHIRDGRLRPASMDGSRLTVTLAALREAGLLPGLPLQSSSRESAEPAAAPARAASSPDAGPRREQEQAARSEREKAEREKAEREKAEREKAERARADQAARDKAGREKAERSEREKAEREKAEKAERERAEREAREKAAREKAEREKAEKATREKAERENAEKAAREKAERERAEKAAREKAERERAEKATREKADREKAERSAREQAQREKAEKAARDRAEAAREAREEAEKAEQEASKVVPLNRSRPHLDDPHEFEDDLDDEAGDDADDDEALDDRDLDVLEEELDDLDDDDDADDAEEPETVRLQPESRDGRDSREAAGRVVAEVHGDPVPTERGMVVAGSGPWVTANQLADLMRLLAAEREARSQEWMERTESLYREMVDSQKQRISSLEGEARTLQGKLEEALRLVPKGENIQALEQMIRDLRIELDRREAARADVEHERDRLRDLTDRLRNDLSRSEKRNLEMAEQLRRFRAQGIFDRLVGREPDDK